MNFRRLETAGGVMLTDFIDHPLQQSSQRKAAERARILSMLREEMNDPALTIGYKKSGQPVVADRPGLFISVSHSNGWCALAISTERAVGVDIQTFTSRLDRGMDYFVNDFEREQLGTDFSSSDLYLIWCAKEAFYKQREGQIADLKNDVTVCIPSGKKPAGNTGILSVLFGHEEYVLSFRADGEKALVFTN